MRIIVDVLGSDKGLKEVVIGAVNAVKEREGFSVVLSGPESEIQAVLSTLDYDKTRVEILNAPDEISCNEHPVEAIRKKSNSSLVVAYNHLKQEGADALVSFGSTGAVLAGGIFKLGRLKGVKRPALAPLLPTVTGGRVLLTDSGANVDCDSSNLYQFAVMGNAYMKKVVGIENPRVALICNGPEDAKGNALTKETFKLLADDPDIEFVGNMEARDCVSGKYDLLIADGFDGNVALKGIECGAKAVASMLKAEIKASFWAKIGYLFMRKAVKNLKNKTDFNKIGGAVLLGVEKVVIKGHGASDGECVKICVLQAVDAVHADVVSAIREGIVKTVKED